MRAGPVIPVGDPVDAPSLGTYLFSWRVDSGAALVVLVVGALYAAGVVRLGRRGRAWPRRRTTAFFAGLAVMTAATQSGVARYDTVLFSAHVVQHLLLGMAAPLLLALGAPVTLALQASRRRTQRGLLWTLHRRPIRLLTHPIVSWLAFGGSLFVLYFSPLFELSLRNDAVHLLAHVHFALAGLVFCWPLVGLDPSPWRFPFGARILSVFLAVPFHAVLGVALISSDTLLADGFYAEVVRDWGPSALTDQRTGAAILWGLGDLWGVTAVLVILSQWMKADRREAARADRIAAA